MHDTSYKHMKEMAQKYLGDMEPGIVVDIGSMDVNGSYRDIFENLGWIYQGVDLSPGKNVDIVLEDVYTISLEEGYADLVISGQAFEHIEFFWKTWLEIVRILKPGGMIFLITPSRGPEHRYPVDCWRFYPDSYHALAKYGEIELLEVTTDWESDPETRGSQWGDTFGVFRKAVDTLKSGIGTDVSLSESEGEKGRRLINKFKLQNEPVVVDIGCGFRKRGNIGIDVSRDNTHADLICNVGFESIPLDDNSANLVTCHDFLEHLPKAIYLESSNTLGYPIIHAMNEIWRILKPDGIFESWTPRQGTVEVHQDPTHLSVWNEESMKYFCGHYPIAKNYGVRTLFEIIEQRDEGFYLYTKLKKPKLVEGISQIESRPVLTIIIVAYNMKREIPKTLTSLLPPYQRDVDIKDYEIILVENDSKLPLDGEEVSSLSSNITHLFLESGSSSPALAMNKGMEMARGEYVCCYVDGARIASPGLLRDGLKALTLGSNTVVSTLGWHIGPDVQMKSVKKGYNQENEDALLAKINWPEDGYKLFEISELAGSSKNGFFMPLAESNALFMPLKMMRKIKGFDTRFEFAGGGLVNLDFYERACSLPDSQLVTLLGEGTFHQVHGGAATNLAVAPDNYFTLAMEEYKKIKNKSFQRPKKKSLYFGEVPLEAMRFLESSINSAVNAAGK